MKPGAKNIPVPAENINPWCKMNRTIFFSFENSASTRALADSPFRTQSVHAIFDLKRALLRINKSICHALKSDKSD